MDVYFFVFCCVSQQNEYAMRDTWYVEDHGTSTGTLHSTHFVRFDFVFGGRTQQERTIRVDTFPPNRWGLGGRFLCPQKNDGGLH